VAKQTFSEWAWDWIKAIAVALAIWFVLRSFLIEPFRIPSESMENTLLVGDWLFVNKAIYGPQVPFTSITLPASREPQRGDILVFDSVEEEGLKVVKRLIGMPGDTIAMRSEVVTVNGRPLEEPYALHVHDAPDRCPLTAGEKRVMMRSWQQAYYIGDDRDAYRPDLHDWGPLVVPPGSYFMMGDNRDCSYDGRYWGFLPRQNVRGRPMFIYYSYDPSSWRALPFLTAIRWSRIFDGIR
jgi:signal peptidase I